MPLISKQLEYDGKKKGNTEVNFLIPEENFEISGILSAETELACALTN